jgi:hypothetical protein
MLVLNCLMIQNYSTKILQKNQCDELIKVWDKVGVWWDLDIKKLPETISIAGRNTRNGYCFGKSNIEKRTSNIENQRIYRSKNS